MKVKQFVSAVLVYLLLITLLPMKFITGTAKAAENTNIKDYSQCETLPYNILKAEIDGDLNYLYTTEGTYIIKKGKEPQFISYNGASTYNVMGRVGDELYFVGLNYYDGYKVNSVNLKTGQVSVKNSLPAAASIIDAIIDRNKVQWLSMYVYDDVTYSYNSVLLRTDDKNNTSILEFPPSGDNGVYANLLQNENKDTLWFMDDIFTYKLGRVSYNSSTNQLSHKYVNFYGKTDLIKNYRINSNGNGWVLDFSGRIFPFTIKNDQLELGQDITANYDDYIMDITLDSQGNVWYLSYGFYVENDDFVLTQKVGKVENGQLIDKYYVSPYTNFGLPRYSVFNVYNENRIVLASNYEYIIIDEGSQPTKSGWVLENGKWFYYNPTTGKPMTGWLFDNGKWYYLRQSGEMATGWVQVNGIWYYLNPSGSMSTGWIKDGGKWYFMNPNGSMATGWIKDGGSWYYLTSSGSMATGWIQVGSKWYYMYSNGKMAYNTVIGGYKLGPDGAWVK